ncbi:uncharacterized protein LOC126902356 isoform X2 [Daktulosphaira vitifoliae]|uniref:uncharacterized protein LOC126902356 isoform X2 n=1 Tax=Daktulosphaira vitifoliae TaxID=58002 RepID=UPI0021A98202|nr:uncharacterized protein LOC126902356 isoform X2 [Daktulosphaira vitifoliae]
MLLLKKKLICFILFLAQMNEEAPRVLAKGRSSNDANVIKTFFKNVPWQHLNDVTNVKYLNKYYKIEYILELPFNRKTYVKKLRIATIFLGCSYANDLKYILFMLRNVTNYCRSLNNHKKLYNCSIEIINNALKTIQLEKKLKGAMDVIDSYHTTPMKENNFVHYLMSSFFDTYHYIKERLNAWPPSQHDSSKTILTLKVLYKYLNQYIGIIEKEIEPYCTINSVDLSLLWHDWYKNNKTEMSQHPNENFYQFINKKVRDKIHETVINKFFDLGFLFNVQTEKVSIPDILLDINKEINTSKLANKTIELNKISYESVGNSQAKIDENFNSEKSFPYNEENQKNTETAEVSKPVQIAFMTNGKPFYTFF